MINNQKQKTAALWTLTNGKESGWSTDTLPSLENLYIPLKGYHENIGILIYKPQKKLALSTESKNFIYTICQQLSNYLERALNREKIYQHDNLLQVQKIHKMILDRFSHAFQWPIESAKTALKNLKEQLLPLEKKNSYPQILTLENTLDVFTKNLENIATMADLSEGMIPLRKSQHPIKEIIEECALSLTPLLNGHTFNIEFKKDLPPIYFDYYLMQVLLNNLLINAIEYSDPGTPIEIEAKKEGNVLAVSVTNRGKGIPEDQLSFIFDKFYRLPDEPLPRSGLGLAIAKTIIELHEGILKVENLPGGIRFLFTLPISD